MSYIEWKDSYSVYNNFLDDQHRRMIEAVNALHRGYAEGHSATEMGMKLTDISALTRTHFQTEEIMMHATLYPGLEQHMQQHKQLLADFDNIVGELARGERELTEELFAFLNDWVEQHIAAEDKEFGDHLRQFTEENPDAEMPAMEADLSA